MLQLIKCIGIDKVIYNIKLNIFIKIKYRIKSLTCHISKCKYTSNLIISIEKNQSSVGHKTNKLN